MKNYFKNFIAFCALSSFVLLLAIIAGVPSPTAATATDLFWGGENVYTNVESSIGLGNEDPRIIIASVINVILGFLGIIAVVIILLAGFKWMTAGGNEDKISEAKGMLTAGVVGLIIILASWGLAKWVVDLIYNASWGNTT